MLLRLFSSFCCIEIDFFFSFPKKSKNFNPNCLHPIIQHDKVAVPLLFMSNSSLEVLNVHNSLGGAPKAKAVYIYYQCTHIVIGSPVYYCRFIVACSYYLALPTKCFSLPYINVLHCICCICSIQFSVTKWTWLDVLSLVCKHQLFSKAFDVSRCFLSAEM